MQQEEKEGIFSFIKCKRKCVFTLNRIRREHFANLGLNVDPSQEACLKVQMFNDFRNDLTTTFCKNQHLGSREKKFGSCFSFCVLFFKKRGKENLLALLLKFCL